MLGQERPTLKAMTLSTREAHGLLADEIVEVRKAPGVIAGAG